MKLKSALAFLLAALAMTVCLISCSRKTDTDQSTLHLSPKMCRLMTEGVSPNEFVNSKGENTFLKNKYAEAYVDKDGCLILTLENQVITEWKNTFAALQVLQCVLGDTRDIGITIDYSKDFLDYMRDADTCGYDISEDFTKVVESAEDNSWYFPFIMTSCCVMQVFEGKSCTEIKIDYVEIDENGEVINTINYFDTEDTKIPIDDVE